MGDRISRSPSANAAQTHGVKNAEQSADARVGAGVKKTRFKFPAPFSNLRHNISNFLAKNMHATNILDKFTRSEKTKFNKPVRLNQYKSSEAEDLYKQKNKAIDALKNSVETRMPNNNKEENINFIKTTILMIKEIFSEADIIKELSTNKDYLELDSKNITTFAEAVDKAVDAYSDNPNDFLWALVVNLDFKVRGR